MLRRLAPVAALAVLLAAPAAAQRRPAAAPGAGAARPFPSGADCERCHGSREFLLSAASDRNVGAGLVVTRATLSGGPHARVACSDCHTGVTFFPHEPEAARRVVCGRCHAAQDSAWRRGVHGPHGPSAEPRAGCADCHGGHGVARAGFLPTAAGRAEMRKACAACHPAQVATSQRDVHADTIACTRCHGSHAMRPVPDEATHRIDVGLARACSRCHPAEAASYWGDIHGTTASRQAASPAALGPDTAATCISCHGEHGIRRAADPTWRFAVAGACTRCHGAFGRSYRDSYHGQASTVGSTRAAKCADCHTPHNVRPVSDTASSVAPAHQIGTCRKCHSEARGKFAGYQPHANPRNPHQNPVLFYVWAFMTAVLTGTMVVWGTHTLLWYRRTSIDRRRREATAGAEMAVAAGGAG
ncbi:MAG TPA: cytochrome c3 family protein, partial [Vicinamibacteria bacterium]|nr:cytochrome c3 family protein [Vicinamibacteria bacterium]